MTTDILKRDDASPNLQEVLAELGARVAVEHEVLDLDGKPVELRAAEHVVGQDYLMGDEEEVGDDWMGARARIPRRPPVPVPRIPITGKRIPCGSTPFDLVAASPPASVSVAEPQRAYQPERLIITASLVDTGPPLSIADVTAIGSVTEIKVGDTNQLPTSGGEVLSMTAFRADAVGAAIDMTSAKPATKLAVFWSFPAAFIAALAATQTVVLRFSWYGRVVGE
jgi:hypothetical protein